MPVQQEIVHWYNTVPDVYNGDIPDDYPDTPDNYPMTEIIELRNLLNRLCDEIGGTLSYGICSNRVEIRKHDIVYSFSISEWLTNRQVVMTYLQDWFPSFRIHHGTELWHEIMDFISDIDSKVSYLYTENDGNVFRFRRNSDRTIIFAFTYNDYISNKRYVYDHLRQLFPYAGIPYIMYGIADYIAPATVSSCCRTGSPIHIRIIGLLNSIMVHYPDNQYSYINGVYRIGRLNFTADEYIANKTIIHDAIRLDYPLARNAIELVNRIDFFEMQALPIAEIYRRIRLDREVRMNGTPNMATRPIDSITTPSPCTGKEEASDINYLDVI